jgi:hypothetical protein
MGFSAQHYPERISKRKRPARLPWRPEARPISSIRSSVIRRAMHSRVTLSDSAGGLV